MALLDSHLMKSAEAYGFKVDKDKINRVFDYTLSDGHIFVCEKDGKIVGVYGGINIESIMSNEIVFQELFLVCEKPIYYPKLIKAVQKNVKCDAVLIVHMADAVRMGKLYNKLGFKEMERQYIWNR